MWPGSIYWGNTAVLARLAAPRKRSWGSCLLSAGEGQDISAEWGLVLQSTTSPFFGCRGGVGRVRKMDSREKLCSLRL